MDEKKHEADTSGSTEFETSDSQSYLNLIDGGDTISAVSVGDGGVLLAGVVAEQKHLLAIERVLRPSDV